MGPQLFFVFTLFSFWFIVCHLFSTLLKRFAHCISFDDPLRNNVLLIFIYHKNKVRMEFLFALALSLSAFLWSGMWICLCVCVSCAQSHHLRSLIFKPIYLCPFWMFGFNCCCCFCFVAIIVYLFIYLRFCILLSYCTKNKETTTTTTTAKINKNSKQRFIERKKHLEPVLRECKCFKNNFVIVVVVVYRIQFAVYLSIFVCFF